ncbi:MAG: T9SS type A sorting domain-containing protein [Ignavibacteria bacterium]|nr:T9SS type A sorting domain-containing protein [Ignavibacteria bacterium]
MSGVWRRSLSELTTTVENNSSHPSSIVLEQNYPNPFNPSTTIRFTLPHSGPVSVEVFSALGEHVATLISEDLSAGTHQTEWDAHSLLGECIPIACSRALPLKLDHRF